MTSSSLNTGVAKKLEKGSQEVYHIESSLWNKAWKPEEMKCEKIIASLAWCEEVAVAQTYLVWE